MPKTCPKHARNMPGTCPEHDQTMPKTCPNHPQTMAKTCPIHCQIMPKTFPNHDQNVPKTLLVVAKSAYSSPKHCLLLRSRHILGQNIDCCCGIDIFLANTLIIIYLELSPPSQNDIAGEVYRGSYRSRSQKGQGPGGSWRYIA